MKKTFLTLGVLFSLCGLGIVVGCGNEGEESKASAVTFTGKDLVYVLAGDDSPLESFASATDSQGNSVQVRVKDNGNFNASSAGRYTVVYEAGEGTASVEKSVVLEVVSPTVVLPGAFAVNEIFEIGQPDIECSAESVDISCFYKLGGGDWLELVFDEGAASAEFSECGKYDFKFIFDLDGQRLEKELSAEGYSVSVDDSKRVATVGEIYEIGTPVFSDNIDSDYSVTYREGDGEWKTPSGTDGNYTFSCEKTGYYTVRYSAECNGIAFDYDFELYTRKAGMDIDLEGADGTHFGMGNSQYENNGKGQALLEISSAWSNDGRYSLKQTSGTYWAGMVYSRPLDVGESNVLVCYIYSEEDYDNVQMSVYTDGENYVEADRFSIRSGAHKYYIAFQKEFSQVKKLIMQATSSTFYIDSLDFALLDVSNVLSLGKVEIDGSGLNAGDTLTLPEPTVSSTVHSKEDLKNGTLRVFAKTETDEEFEIPRGSDGKFSFKVKPAGYTFRYVFEYDDDIAELSVFANIAKFNLTADCPETVIVGERTEIKNIAGHASDSAITVTLLGNGKNEVLKKDGNVYYFSVDVPGYYRIRIYAENADKNGETEYEFYAREYDMTLDFEGVNENRGYVQSYTAEGMNGYVSLSKDWANDGKYSIYFDMISTKVWYGTKGMNIDVVNGSNSVTFTMKALANFQKDTIIWIETDKGSFYSEAFRIKAGVNTYKLRFGANASGVLGANLPSFGAVKTFAFACVDAASGYTEDKGKYFYIDSVVFHPYSEFSTTFVRPEIAMGETYILTPPAVTSEYLTPDEISALEFWVVYETPDGQSIRILPKDGKYEIIFDKPGIYKLTLSYRHRYCIRTATYEYAYGTIIFEPELPEKFVTDEDILLEQPILESEEDISGAEVKISYSPKGKNEFIDLTKKLGKFVLNEKECGYYTLRYEVVCGAIQVVKDFDIYIRQAGVFMDFEAEGSNGYVDTPYENEHFLPELSDEWSYDGNNSVKVEFYSDAWYGFTHSSDSFVVPAGTDKLSVWIKSETTFTYNSLLAFTAYDSSSKKYVWYYTEEFKIQAGINVYEVGIRLYTNLSQAIDFTPAQAGRIDKFVFHTEKCTPDSPDFGLTAYFDSIRFMDTEESNFNDLTLLPAHVNQPYTLSYASPSGFSDEHLIVSYRKEGSSEWIDMYESKSYDGAEEIVYTFDFTGRIDIRIIAVSGNLFASWQGSITVSA